MASLDNKVHVSVKAIVEMLLPELPGMTFGYLGTCGIMGGHRYDDRDWYVFLPHPGRCGEWADRVHVDDKVDLEALPAELRRMYGIRAR